MIINEITNYDNEKNSVFNALGIVADMHFCC